MTEEWLAEFVAVQNKALPTRLDDTLELVRMASGPGLRVTFVYRFVDPNVDIDTYTSQEWRLTAFSTTVRNCTDLKAALDAGLTVATDYTDAFGKNLIGVIVTKDDCAEALGTTN